MSAKITTFLAIAAIPLAGCSSAPRNFAPVLASAPADPKLYEAQWQACREQVAAATKNGSGRLGSAAAGTAAGAGAGVAAGAAASGTYATYGAAALAGAATIAVIPIFGLAGAWGISKIKKTKKERAIKTATADCLQQSGFSVADWRVLSKKEARMLSTGPNPDSAAAVAAVATEPPPPMPR